LKTYFSIGGFNLNCISITLVNGTKVQNPVITLNTGIYVVPQKVTISFRTEGAVIYYTTDGTEPPELNGTLYTGEFIVSATSVVKAIACKLGKKF
jgi:hypothetical protein